MLQEIKNIEKLDGIRVFRTSFIKNGSGICLPGIGIFIHSEIPDSDRMQIIQHEYGHFLDYQFGVNEDLKKLFNSRFLGFYILIGIPSVFNLIPILNRIPYFSGPHRTFWTEIRANRLAKAHFGDSIAKGFDRNFPTISSKQKEF